MDLFGKVRTLEVFGRPGMTWIFAIIMYGTGLEKCSLTSIGWKGHRFKMKLFVVSPTFRELMIPAAPLPHAWVGQLKAAGLNVELFVNSRSQMYL